jgi:hypothetical protein
MNATNKSSKVQPVFVNTYMGADVKRRFRIACAEEGITMSSCIVGLIETWLKERKK